MQLRRLDRLQTPDRYVRLSRNPVKSFSLTEAQYDRVTQERPYFVAREGEGAVIGLPLRDFLEVHYAFPDIEMFVDRFAELFERVIGASSKQEAPRGLVIAFRDRPNRPAAETVFWSVALDQGEQWVEMTWSRYRSSRSPWTRSRAASRLSMWQLMPRSLRWKPQSPASPR